MKRNLTVEIILSGILLLLTVISSAQELKISDYKRAILDVSARENPVYDANGDACAMIKIRTGLTDLKFSSDLGINKIESRDGEFWLWVSPNTSEISILADSIGKVDYELPVPLESLNVYTLSLVVLFPDRYQFRDIYSFRIATKPEKAEIYIDDAFMGVSPLTISIPQDTFRYTVFKKRYLPNSGFYRSNTLSRELSVYLEKDPHSNRFYMMPFCGINNQVSMTFGIETGSIGRTGWFVSLVPPLRSKYYIAKVGDTFGSGIFSIEWIEEKFIKKVGESSANYYYTLPEDSSFMNNFRAIAGVTQRISENVFLKIGFGEAFSTRYYRINVIRNTGSPLTDSPTDGKYYARGSMETYCYVIKAGLAYRRSNQYLVSFDAITGINPWSENISPLKLEFTFGLGYNF